MRLWPAAIALMLASPALAGPPYATDDPDSAPPGTFETFLFTDGAFDNGDYAGEVGVEVNYGLAPDLQLSLGLPADLQLRDRDSLSRGNVAASVKWRFYENEASGASIAIFPEITLPTARGASGVEILAPLWGGVSRGGWTMFGGGGRIFSTNRDARDRWLAALALTREIGSGVTLGVEGTYEGADAPGGHTVRALGLGGVFALGGPFALVARGGPAFEAGTGHRTVQIFLGLQGLF